MREALKDTHDIFIDRRLKTHGDFFATRKDVSEALKRVEEKNGFKIIHRVGLPDKAFYE